MKRRRVMRYDDGQNRWVVRLNGDLYGLHCGEMFEMIIGSHVFPCRLELGTTWYIIMPDVAFHLRTTETYKINI